MPIDYALRKRWWIPKCTPVSLKTTRTGMYAAPGPQRLVARGRNSWPIDADAKPANQAGTLGGHYWPPTAERIDCEKAAPSLTTAPTPRHAKQKTYPADPQSISRMISIEGNAGVPTAPVPLLTPPRSPGPAVGGPSYLLTMDPIVLGNTSPSNGCVPQGHISPCPSGNTPTLSRRYGGSPKQRRLQREASIPIRA